MDVVMAISPQSAIDTMVTCVKRAGRTVAAIDVEPLSIARSIQTSYDDLLIDKTICVVDIGHNTSAINIYQGNKLLMPRQVPIGGELFTKAIADAQSLPMSDAEKLKREQLTIPETAGIAPVMGDPFGLGGGGAGDEFQPYNPFGDDAGFAAPVDATTTQFQTPDFGAADPYDTDPVAAPDMTEAFVPPSVETMPVVASNPLYEAIAITLEELVSEIRRSIDYYRSRGGDVNQIEICGGGAKIAGLAPYIERSVGIACDTFDPTRRLNINARKVPQDFVDQHRGEFAVAIGNGLHIFFD
jgi:type IV pilus assembly protein PilM